MKLLGLGADQLIGVPVDSAMRLNADRLDEIIADLHEKQIPILSVVGILGTTEFGTIDPIHKIVECRDKWRPQGLEFGIHVDAAWGGFLSTMFRNTDGTLAKQKNIQSEFKFFPSDSVYQAFAAIAQTDSITIDPHKLGYLPYPSGAFIARNREVVHFLTQTAAYVFDIEDKDNPKSTSEKLYGLGQYILEGSKPGSSAAAAHVTYNVLPLHREGFGKILQPTIDACEYFYSLIPKMQREIKDIAKIITPMKPDTNLICLAINPKGNRSLGEMNRFGRKLFDSIKVAPGKSMLANEYYGSYTSIFRNNLEDDVANRIIESLDIDPGTFVLEPQDLAKESDHIFILRHTLMNPWLLHEQDEENFIDRYVDYLIQQIKQLCE